MACHATYSNPTLQVMAVLLGLSHMLIAKGSILP
jgi:hypothetical protein